MFTSEVNAEKKSFLGVFFLLTLFNAMNVGDTKTVFKELIPNDKNCSRAGEHGCLCYRNLDCNSTKYLECIDGKCGCEFGMHRKFDESLGKCVSLVGSMCIPQWGWTPECTRNAECELGRCSCRAGYSRTAKNTCKINFGEACGPNQCNSDRGLACKEGKCSCVDSTYVYSILHSNCLDPEAVVRNIIQQITDRIFREIFNYKRRRVTQTVTAPFRLLGRLALGPLGILIG